MQKPSDYHSLEGALVKELGGLRRSFEQGPPQDASEAPAATSTMAVLPRRALPWRAHESNRSNRGLVHSMASSCIAQILEENKRSGFDRMRDTIGSPDLPAVHASRRQLGNFLDRQVHPRTDSTPGSLQGSKVDLGQGATARLDNASQELINLLNSNEPLRLSYDDSVT